MKERSAMKKRFTIGIDDDLTYILEVGKPLDLTNPKTYQAKFWGFGSDGTVGRTSQQLRLSVIIQTSMRKDFSIMIQKSGGLTVSHLRFGETPIRSTYLIEHSDFVACHTAAYLHTYDLVKGLKRRDFLKYHLE